MYLARKISRAKWGAGGLLTPDEIPADAITSDLRTQGNALSFWQCGGGTKKEVEEAALALLAAGNRIDRIDVVWLDDDKLRQDGQELTETDGKTAVEELIDQHMDLSSIDYKCLGLVASRIIEAMGNDQYRRLSKREAMNLLSAAIEQGRLDRSDLPEKVVADLDSRPK